MMKTHLIALAVLATAIGAAPHPAVAQQSRMKECADQWKQMKAAHQTAGRTYRAFSKECLAQGDAAASGSGATTGSTTATKPAAAPARTTTAPAAKPSGGRAAMVARERACGAEWKADKAAGKIPAGMTWPKYWSQCNARKKAEGT